VLVCDTAGPLSIAGVMGGLESEISDQTADILLEGAAWNFINIRRTARAQNLPSEASYRFSRGVHPSLAEAGVRRGLELMQAWAGGEVAPGLVDSYPLPWQDPVVTLSAEDVERWLGIKIPVKDMISHLTLLGFECTKLRPGKISARVPDHRMDIGEGISGKADLIEEIARIHGYQNIPETRISDLLPLQLTNHELEQEERIRDLLVDMGLTEIVSYRWTTPEREALLQPVIGSEYLRIANPLAVEKSALRRSVLASVLDTCERNSRLRERVALFEIGPAFLASQTSDLPEENHHLAIVLTGPRSHPGWQPADLAPMDFYDLKGMLSMLFEGLHVSGIQFLSHQHPSYHPGKCARMMVGDEQVGMMGELHPDVRAHYDLPVTFKAAIQAAEIDLDALHGLIPILSTTLPLTTYPPVLEDLAVVVDETISAEVVADLIRQTGGRVVTDVRLFDLYRGEKIGAGKKSLAYRLTYQAPDKTLSDRDVAGIRARILKQLEKELGAALRS
jgi:phenylalanyl-tRNA synthetase beta chain